MEQSKFIKTLQKLSRRQQNQYLDFLRSPYFNKNEDIQKFAELVFAGKVPLDKEKLFKALYPGKPFNARRIPDLMYKSLKLLEEFLSEEKYANQTWERKINLLSYIRENELDDLNTVVQKEIQELSARKTLRDSDYFYEEFLYHSETDKMFLDQARREADQSLQNKVDQLDLFYLAAKLRESCEMMNRKQILTADFEFHLLEDLLDAIANDIDRYKPYPAILIYYQIMIMLRDPEQTSHYFDLKARIDAHIHLFGQEEQRSLYGYLQNYCIKKVNRGRSEFYPELLHIYKHMISDNLMRADNKNLQWDLKNMVSIALRLGEYQWTLDIINIIKDDLPDDSRDNAYTYNLANYYYETKDYKRATKLLQSVEFTDVAYYLGAKSMLLKMYFEQEEEEAFYALVSAFKTYLTRNKLISKATSLTYQNLLKFSRKAFVFKTQLPYQRKASSKKIKALKETVLETKNVMNLNWLVKEIDQIFGD